MHKAFNRETYLQSRLSYGEGVEETRMLCDQVNRRTLHKKRRRNKGNKITQKSKSENKKTAREAPLQTMGLIMYRSDSEITLAMDRRVTSLE